MHCLHERVGRFMQEHLEEMSIDNQNCNLFPFFWSCEAWRPLDNLIRVREILQLAGTPSISSVPARHHMCGKRKGYEIIYSGQSRHPEIRNFQAGSTCQAI